MTLQEIVKGESKNVEFKAELPKKSEKYMKSVIAFANASGGTSRPADCVKIKELELEGANLSWDELTCVGYRVNEDAV